MVSGKENCIWKGNFSSHVTGNFAGTRLYEVSYHTLDALYREHFYHWMKHYRAGSILFTNDVTHSVVSSTAMKIFSGLYFLFQICTNWMNGKH